jgi:hypothetical protein
MIQLLNPDLTPLDSVTITHFEAGQDSDAIPFVIQNTGPDQTDLLLVIQAEHTATGLVVSAGLPPLDELWTRARLTGPEPIDWTPIGTTRGLHIATLLSGAIRAGEIRFRPLRAILVFDGNSITVFDGRRRAKPRLRRGMTSPIEDEIRSAADRLSNRHAIVEATTHFKSTTCVGQDN